MCSAVTDMNLSCCCLWDSCSHNQLFCLFNCTLRSHCFLFKCLPALLGWAEQSKTCFFFFRFLSELLQVHWLHRTLWGGAGVHVWRRLHIFEREWSVISTLSRYVNLEMISALEWVLRFFTQEKTQKNPNFSKILKVKAPKSDLTHCSVCYYWCIFVIKVQLILTFNVLLWVDLQ